MNIAPLMDCPKHGRVRVRVVEHYAVSHNQYHCPECGRLLWSDTASVAAAEREDNGRKIAA